MLAVSTCVEQFVNATTFQNVFKNFEAPIPQIIKLWSEQASKTLHWSLSQARHEYDTVHSYITLISPRVLS